MKRVVAGAVVAICLACGTGARGQVYNLKIVTDASPDYSDMPSLVHSVTAKWQTPEEKCWAMFYWNHIARRQTAPVILHGTELTDPIRQFNDYGYTMCSTISGINCGLWFNMGLAPKFWDISLHTVPEVFYDGRWHMYDNSMSAIYTLCDGHTIAGVEDIGKEGACTASGGKPERGHIAKYHCLYSTGPDGFLTGADTQRSLDEEAHCFNPNALKYRYYYYNWDFGHRYILNVRDHESYTRYYKSVGSAPDYFVANHGKDPDERYHLRGNGVWEYKPDLANYSGEAYWSANITKAEGGLSPADSTASAEIVFKVRGANVITSQKLKAAFARKNGSASSTISVSSNNGLSWSEVWKSKETGDLLAEVPLREQVNGVYEVLIKVSLTAQNSPSDISLKAFEAQTTTMLNAKTQPRLNLGKNTIYVGAGDQTESIVFWPELAGGKYKEQIVAEKNIASAKENPGYMGTLFPAKPVEDGYVVYRIDAPADLTRLTYGGRFYNRARHSHIDLLYSLDGETWTKSWSLRRTTPPWDVIHYETVEIPKGHRSVWIRYLMNSPEASASGCSIYALRMEANHAVTKTSNKPMEITFDWSEPQQDRSLKQRSHTELVTGLPFRYTINAGGADHPIMNSLRVKVSDPRESSPRGYSDGNDIGGERFVPKWIEYGSNLAMGKSYTLSKPSGTNWDAGDPDGKKLTRGAGGPPYAGGTSYRSGALWEQNANPVITLDLDQPVACASFGMNFHGYPWWDAIKGEVQDKVEVLTSLDGKEYVSQGFLKTDLRWVDLPVNHMWTDEETMTGGTFRYAPPKPVTARYVQYKVSNKRVFDCTQLEVLDSIRSKPFDLRVALPDEAGPIISLAPPDNGTDAFTIPGAPASLQSSKVSK